MAAQHAPYPFLSCFVDDCIGKGVDITAGGAAYNFTEPSGVGETNAADALAAIEKLVYRDQTHSLAELVAAAKGDYEGSEEIRSQLIRAPKFGNDDDTVDAIQARIVDAFCKEVLGHENTRGGRYYPGFLCWIMHSVLGKKTPATLDGRKSGEALAACLGPAQGMDKKGPTAMMKSVTKCDVSKCLGGLVLNAKFNPATMQKHRESFASLIRAFFRLGGFELQINVMDRETLRLAQDKPEEYANLVVRVAGYSTYFTTLDRQLQDDVIARTTHIL
jgi:formate C-acetyltransferase